MTNLVTAAVRDQLPAANAEDLAFLVGDVGAAASIATQSVHPPRFARPGAGTRPRHRETLRHEFGYRGRIRKTLRSRRPTDRARRRDRRRGLRLRLERREAARDLQ